MLRDKGVFGKVDQMPVVLIPVHFDRGLLSMEPSARHSIVLRPFKSSDLLSGTAAVPGKDIPNDVRCNNFSAPLYFSGDFIFHNSNVFGWFFFAGSSTNREHHQEAARRVESAVRRDDETPCSYRVAVI